MRFRGFSALTAAMALVATCFTGLIGAGPAGASSTVAYSATVTIPVPPASTFASGGGGDGWGIALTSSAVYNVFHYGSLQVACHLQVNAANCWPSGVSKTITQSTHSFSTSGEPGMYLDHSDGHLFVWATRDDDTAGVVCIDTTQPAGNLNPFCGFTALSAVGAADSGADLSGPALVGSNWYAFNLFSDAASTGTENKVLCFNVATHAACASQPFTVNLGAGTVSGDDTYSAAAFGSDLIIPIDTSTTGSNSELLCLNTTTKGACAGTWPKALSFDYAGSFGAAYPLENSAGTIDGFCLPTGTDPCYTLSGATATTPAGMPAAFTATDDRNGTAFLLGPRVYIPDGSLDRIDCWDYATGKTCVNFPLSLTNNEATYTLTPDPQRASCIWVNADGGTAQIQDHDAFTTAGCGTGPIRVLAAEFIPPLAICVPSSFTSLQVQQPVRSTYTSGTVAFEDGDGNPIPGIATRALDSTGSTGLSALHLVTTHGLPQFLITLTGEKNKVGAVVVKVTWTGTASPSCLTQGATNSAFANGLMLEGADGGMFGFGPRPSVGAADFGGLPGPLTTPLHQVIPTPFTALTANADRTGYWDVLGNGQVFPVGNVKSFGDLTGRAPATTIVGIAATAGGGGYWLAGADGSIYPFGDAGKTFGSMAGHHLNGPIVAIVATTDGGGYWLIASDGGVFPFGDAAFHGSLGATHLNAPIDAAAASPVGGGYVLAAGDGGLWNFGTSFHGSLGATHLNKPIVAVAMTTDGGGYWMVGADGGIFPFGDAPFQGSLPGRNVNLRAPIVGAVN